MSFLGRFSKIHQTFLHTLFSAEGKVKRGADVVNRISQFRYAIKNALHIYRGSATFLAFLQTVEPISHYCMSGQHSYTRRQLADTSDLSSERPDFIFEAENLSF